MTQGLVNNFQKITTNLSGPIRYEMLEGRRHLVVHTSILTEDVHEGNNGPVFYPNEELSAHPGIWNHRPIVVYHPEKDGKAVTACSHDIINSRKIGITLEANWNGKLGVESWLDEERTKEIDKRIIENLEAGKPVEVSTGLYADPDPTPGEWNGKKYTIIARNHKPDHLAILPDMLGACSIEDGCGMLVNGCKCKGECDKCKSKKAEPTANALAASISHETVREKLAALLQEGWGYSYWIVEVFSNYFIYCDYDSNYRKMGYSVGVDGSVTLSGNAVAVEKIVTYETLQARLQEVKQLVDNGLFSNADRTFLVGLSKEQFSKVVSNVKKEEPMSQTTTPATTPAPAATPPVTTPEPTTNATPVATPAVTTPVVETPAATPPMLQANTTPAAGTPAAPAPTPPRQMTVNEYVAQAPPGVRDMLEVGLQQFNATREVCINNILANKGNKFTKEWLQERPWQELQALEALALGGQPQAQPAQPSYLGAVGAPITNRNQHVQAGLPLPGVDWSK